MSVVYRQYRESDRDGFIHCIGLLQDFVASLDPLHRIRRLKDFDANAYVEQSFDQLKKHDGAIFIAEEKGRIIGCIIGVIHLDEPEDIEGYPSIDGKILDLIVLPEYRGQHVGNELMRMMEEYLASKNCDVIKVECSAPNRDARKFYEKLGYSERILTLIKSIEKR